MSDNASDGLRELEVVVEEEVTMIESSGIAIVLTESEDGWRYDPVDVQSEEVRLRSLRGAIEVLEAD